MTTINVPDATVPAEKTATYRVFEYAGDGLWSDLGITEFTGRYTARPDAEELGARWGEGEYLFFEVGKNWASVEFVTVVAETVYRQKPDDEEA